MARTRQDRLKDFDKFYNDAKEIFTGFRDNDARATKFQNIYMLNVCPGSRAGGTNNRVVEAFWGSRPFETITQGRSWMALTEYGATLIYERDDSGFVIVSLFPAKTDNRKPIESSITLNIWLDPIRLDKSFLERNWNDLIAYMECTSLDGNPTAFQKLRIWYLRTFKTLIVDNTWTPTKFSMFIKDVLKWVLTVGLSGLIIYAITLFNQPSNLQTEILLIKANEELNTISVQLDSVLKKQSEHKQ